MEYLLVEKQKLDIKVNNGWYYLSLVVLFALFFVRDFGIININPLFFILYTSGLFFVFDLSKSLSLIFVLCCVGSAMQILYAILIGLLFILIKNYNKIRLNMNVVLPWLLMIWELLHVMVFGTSFNEYLRWSSGFITMIILVSLKKDEVDFKLLIKTFSLAVILTCFIILMDAIKYWNGNLVAMIENGYRLGRINEYPNMLFRMSGNSNALGSLCNLALSCELVLFVGESSRKEKFWALIRCILLAILGFTTLSRTFLVVFFAIFILFIFFFKCSIKRKLIFILSFCLIGLFALLAIYMISPEIIINFLERFTVDDISNGRIEGIIFYLKVLNENPDWFIFGIGSQEILTVIAQRGYIWPNVPHNGIIEMLLCFGIIGSAIIFFMFITLIWDVIIKYRLVRKFNLILLIPMMVLIIEAQAGQFFKDYDNIILICMSYLVMFALLDFRVKGVRND